MKTSPLKSKKAKAEIATIHLPGGRRIVLEIGGKEFDKVILTFQWLQAAGGSREWVNIARSQAFDAAAAERLASGLHRCVEMICAGRPKVRQRAR